MEEPIFLRTKLLIAVSQVFLEQKRQEMVEDRTFSYSAHLLLGPADSRSFLEQHQYEKQLQFKCGKALLGLTGKELWLTAERETPQWTTIIKSCRGTSAAANLFTQRRKSYFHWRSTSQSVAVYYWFLVIIIVISVSTSWLDLVNQRNRTGQ